jgi:hypothetical protein
MKNIKINPGYAFQASVRYAKRAKIYCWKHKWYITLCRVDDCEHWQDCYKAIVDTGYELVPDRRKNSPTGLRWKLNK